MRKFRPPTSATYRATVVKKFRATLSPGATFSATDLENETLVRYLADITQNHETLTNEQVAALVTRMRAGDAQAREELIVANLPLAIAVAMFYRGRGVEINDLIQEGNIGLMRAVEKYAPEMEFAFSTYAIWWIHREIFNALASQAGAIPISERFYRLLRTRVRIVREIQERTGKAATREEIQAALKISEETMGTLDAADHAVSVESIETPVPGLHNTEPQRLEDFLASPEPPDLEFTVQQIAALPSALRRIRPTEEMILRMRFRIELQGEAPTLQVIADLFGLTRERVRQIERDGLVALRRLLGPDGEFRGFGRYRPSIEGWLGHICGRCWRSVATCEAFCSQACAQAWWSGVAVRGDTQRQDDTLG